MPLSYTFGFSNLDGGGVHELIEKSIELYGSVWRLVKWEER